LTVKPVVIVAGRRAEHKPVKNRLTIDFLLPKQNGGRMMPGRSF